MQHSKKIRKQKKTRKTHVALDGHIQHSKTKTRKKEIRKVEVVVFYTVAQEWQ